MLRLLTNRGGTRERAMAASGDDGGNVLLLRNPSTLIGSSADCDIQIRCAGIRPRHALIEFCPKTGGYWLRQLLPFEEKAQRRVRRQMATSESMPPPPYPYEEEEEEGHRRDDSEEEEERSRKVTQEQVLQDGTMVQLRPADTLRFGIGPQAVEFAFKMPPLAQRQNKRSGSFGNSTTGGGRMGGRMGSPDQQPASDLSLPIVGNRILPRMHADRFARPRQAGPRLCHLQQQQQGAAYATNPPPPNYSSFQQLPNGVSMLRRSVSASRIIAIGERGPIARGGESSGDENGGGNQRRGRKEGWRRQQRGIPGGTSVDSMALDDPLLMATVSSTLPRMMMASGSSGGGGGQNHQKVLLQRIRHLQTELHRRDQEIALLKVQMVAQQGRRPESSSNVTDGSPPASSFSNSAENCFQEALARAHEENERLRAELRAKKGEEEGEEGGGRRRRGWGKQRTVVDDADDRMEGGGDQLAPPHARLNELVYETFFQVCTQEMDSLNKRLSMMPLRDYSDIFGEMHKILHEPFSFRLMEVNTKCSVVFESMRHNLKPSDRDQLYVQFDQFLKQKIFPISKPVDSFLSTLRESAAMARESARACTVFSQWSREFGDQLQLQPNWDLMLFKVRDLQTRFREHGLPKHWLPPSLMPLLEVLIYERKNWADEQQRREKQLAESLAKANQRCDQLEAELVQKREATAQIDEGGENAGISAAATIPRIELPTTPSGGNGGTSEEADAGGEEHRPSSRRSPRSPRSARSSRGSLKQMMSGASEDEDSVQQQHSPRPEARMNSPRTPPPSYRVVPPLVAQIEESAGEEKEEEDGGDDEPWGDRGEQEEEAEEEGKNENNKMEEEELGGATKGRAIRTAIVHLNQVYEEIRAKSRVTSPADGIVDGGGGGGEFMHFGQHGMMKGRAKSAAEGTGAMTNDGNIAEEEGERRRRSASAEGPRARSPSSDSDQSLVKEESESEDDEQQGQMALLHLYSFYADLDEQRRKSQSTVDGGDGEEEEGEAMTARLVEEEEEVGGGKEEVGRGGGEEEMGGGEEVSNSQQEGATLMTSGEIEKDDERKERDEKIVRAEKAILLGSNSKKDSTTTSTTPETVREVVTKMVEEEESGGTGKRVGRRMSSEDQREFERIEKEVMGTATTEAREEAGQQQPKRENVEFWEFVHKVASMLSVDLLPIRQETTNEENSSRPGSVVEVECRQRAADSILSRLKTILHKAQSIH